MTQPDNYLLGRGEAEEARLKRQIADLAPDSIHIKVCWNFAAACASLITIRSLSCRLRPDAEKFAAPVRNNRPSL